MRFKIATLLLLVAACGTVAAFASRYINGYLCRMSAVEQKVSIGVQPSTVSISCKSPTAARSVVESFDYIGCARAATLLHDRECEIVNCLRDGEVSIFSRNDEVLVEFGWNRNRTNRSHTAPTLPQ